MMTIKIIIVCSSFPKFVKSFPTVTSLLLSKNPLPAMLPYLILNPNGQMDPNDGLVRILSLKIFLWQFFTWLGGGGISQHNLVQSSF